MPKTPSRTYDPRVIAAAVAVPVIAFVAMNFGYFSARVSLLLRGPSPVADVTPPAAAQEPEPRMAPHRLVIPSLGIEAPLIYGAAKSEAAFQLALRDGVVHYPGTALPGEPGNAYYFGHSSDYAWAKGDYKTVFATLTEIAVGAVIIVSDADGVPYGYAVTGTRVVTPKDLSVLDQRGREKKLLTLQTSYPIGTALRRFIVEAELVD